MISEILLELLKISFFTSILIGVLLLLVPVLKKRYRANWRYIVWLVIAVRLLIPMGISLPQSPFRVELPEQVESVVYAPTINKLEESLTTTHNPSTNRQERIEAWLEPDDVSQYMETSEVMPEPGSGSALTSFTLMEFAGYIWLAGFIVFLLFQVCSYQIFLHRMKTSQIEIAPDDIKETVLRFGKAMGLRKLPEPYITSVVDAPVLVGLLKPRILLPHNQYGNEEFSFILRHELVHYHRRDMLYKLILMMANALHWFNPLVYLMTVQAAKDIELVCDDAVIRELDHDSRVRYGNTILSTLPKKRRLEPMFSTHFGSSKKNIKDRLRNLFDASTKRRGFVALCAVIICTIITTNIVTLGYAADSISTKETTHSTVTINPNGSVNVINYPGGVISPSTDKIPIQVNQTGYKILLEVEVKGESIRKLRLLSPDGKTDRIYHINENGVQGGNQEYLTFKNMLHLVSGTAETGTWTLYVDSPKIGESISVSAQLIDKNKYTFKTEEISETAPLPEPGTVTNNIPIKKDLIYDYYRPYDEVQNDIKSGYVFYMDKSFDTKAMPTVTGIDNIYSFKVHHNNKLNIDISMKNLISNSGNNAEIFAPESKIRFELISPTGDIVYSFLRSGKDLEKTQAITKSVALTPGEWKYSIEFAYLTNGADISNLKISAQYDKIYQEDIDWLLAHKLNGIDAETNENEAKIAQKPLQNMSVRANAYDGTWAAASSIEGNTWQAQINDEIKWISDTYEENKTGFIITEALPKQEVSNVSRTNYLYENSNIFRDMSKMDSGVYVVENGQSFTSSGFTLTSDTIHRTVVMVEGNSDLYLDVDYTLKTGKMAVWLIDPDGKIVYQGGLNSSYKGNRTVSGKKGLWSVVRIFQGDEDLYMSGNITVTLRQNGITPASPIPASSITSTSIGNGQPYFQIVSKNGKNIANSGGFFAKAGQKLTITAESSIKGGTVDLFLFSPSNTEQRFTFDSNNKTVTVELTAGTWAYNCTGFYESGNIVITGVFDGGVSGNKSYAGEQILNNGTEKYDNEAIRRMNASGTWGDYIEQLLPNMSPSAVEAVVDIYLERHLFENITTPDAARHVSATIAPALEYMTKEAKESAEKRIAAYY